MTDENIKNSFKNVKGDISALNKRIILLEEQLAELQTLPNSPKFEDLGVKRGQNSKNQQEISSGNVGVHSINHSTNNQSFNDHSLNIQSLREDLGSQINNLTTQEFLVFLTVYQLEDDFKKGVTYNELSSKLKLTTGCIRSYISGLIRKGVPILKKKINNRTVILTIHPDFRSLNLKERLTNLYYHKDPSQTRLF